MLSPLEVEDYFGQIGVEAQASRGDWRDALCPFHEDRSRSFTFNVKSGGWKCQAGCGHGGLKEIADRSQIPFPRGTHPNNTPQTPKKTGEKVLECAYDYQAADGSLAYQVLRYRKGASKTFRQRHPDGAGGWIWKMDGVTPLPYRLPEILAADTGIPVFVCEGEKDVDNLISMGLLATTNHGGAGKWKAEHAKHLAGRQVVIVPDNDAPGRKHAEQVAASLAGIALETRILELPDLPEKGDVSDWLAQGRTKEALLGLAAVLPLWTPPAATQALESVSKASTPSQNAPFIALGYVEGQYYYLSRQTNQVVALTAAAHGKLPLLSLAPMSYWGKAYGTDNGGIAWNSAAGEMMAACSRMGVFDYSCIRGRGAWFDNGRPVVHLGNSVIVNGERRPPGQPEAEGYIYPAAIPIPIDYANPLQSAEAARLSTLCDMLPWERPINGRLLAGWLALAPICGALAWRPHIWISGAAGTGKSWIMDNIMRPMLGRVGLFVQGDTTEAGIRQALGYDARPVLFDEAEGESERSQVRMQNVMALMRQSSSENGSVIVKGSMSGAVKVYCVRSCFAFSSIGVGIKQHSDRTRVTVLSLVKPDSDLAAERFAEIRAETADLLSRHWVGGLHARMIALIPIIRENSETFAKAAAVAIGSQRMGDQVGALLAGAYALHNDGLITQEDAAGYVDKQDWEEQTAIQETPDERLCLDRILQHVIRLQDNGHTTEHSVAELISLSDSGLDPDGNAYRATLLRLGIRVSTDEIAIANQHAGLQKILAGTNWADWGRILKRIPGAVATNIPIRFAGMKARATTIPRYAISN